MLSIAVPSTVGGQVRHVDHRAGPQRVQTWSFPGAVLDLVDPLGQFVAAGHSQRLAVTAHRDATGRRRHDTGRQPRDIAEETGKVRRVEQQRLQ
jgi:hypothetical protein